MQNVFIPVDCTGETTQQKYSGTFELKLFLSHKEMASAKREANGKTYGLMTTPKWNMNYLLVGLRDEIPGMDEKEKLGLTKEQIDRIVGMVMISCPVGDPEADVMVMIAELNSHIVSAPSWWGRKDGDLGGYDLLDAAPIAELKRQLDKLQRNLTQKPADK
jgi:hypothetical protein